MREKKKKKRERERDFAFLTFAFLKIISINTTIKNGIVSASNTSLFLQFLKRMNVPKFLLV